MNTSNTMDEKYTEAIQSLKKINNELFYDDLKKLMKDREDNITALSEEVYESIETMKRSMEIFPGQVSEQLKEEVVTHQSELFDRRMERFDENIIVLEKKISFWHQQYQEYIERTEKLLADVKGFQQEDQEFIIRESERVLTGIKHLAEALSEQASTLNVKYEVVSERLSIILKEVAAVENNHKEELSQLSQQVVQVQQTVQDKLQQSMKGDAKRESQFKKWLIGLAVGQGVSIILLVLQLFM